MGKFLEAKGSGLQGRIIKKSSKPLGKSIEKRKPEFDEFHKPKLGKRKLHPLKDQEQPLKKQKTKIVDNDTKKKDAQNKIESEFQDLQVEEKRNMISNRGYLKLVRYDEDLFVDDDLKARYDQFTKFNFIFTIFDEIALEGLDGITLEAYWKRLHIALKSCTYLDCVKEFIWHVICSNDKIMFYKLQEPRQNLVLLSRDAFVNKETNTFMEIYQTGPDPYKVELAPKGSIWGSSATLSTRVDISEQVRNMTLQEAYYTYKNKLVMVADQKLRTNALFDELTDPNYEYTQTEYCLLERIGRSRELGEITQGPAAVSHYFGMDSRSLYHYCKRFNKENLVTKQFFCVRSTMDQNKIGRLLQLRRFYSKKKSKYMILAETIINYLKRCPGYKAPYKTVKSLFLGNVNHKFFKSSEFTKYVDTQVFIPYKEYHPEATYKEYMIKSFVKERVIQLMQLKDPFINIIASWSDSPHPDSSDDEDENENDDDTKIGRGRILNMEFIREMYLFIHSKGKEGCTTQDVNLTFDVDFPTIRTVLRKLVTRKLVECRKHDVGRQKTNQYLAKCFIENPDPQISYFSPPRTEPNSAIERLKEKQKRKIDSVEKTRVYTREQFEADQQLDLLDLDKPSQLPVTFTVPQIICEYLISKLSKPNVEETVSLALAKVNAVLRPYKLNLTFPNLGDATIQLRPISPSNEAEKIKIPELKINLTELYHKFFKPDYLTKACLLQAHFGDKPINSTEVIELLDPDFKTAQQAVKRSRPVEVKAEPDQPQASTTTKKTDLATFMGPNPVLVAREHHDSDLVSELYMSTPPKAYKMGDITEYVCPPDISTTDRVLSRINLILKIIQTSVVFEEIYKLLRMILVQEQKDGYDKKMDRKSLHRIINRLVNEGYVKLYQCILSNKSVKKTQSYICHPEVDHHHETIVNGIEQIKFRFFCGSKKDLEMVEPHQKKKKIVEVSPFGEEDVLQSIQEINELHPPKHITLKAISSKRAGKLYGFRPKFARMSVLHEVLFYLIYVLDKNTKALPKEQILELFKTYKINLTDEDLRQLPPVYCEEISWKMFIPPLPQHLGWEDGWALICDVILRIPLSLMVRLYCLNFLSTELQELLYHPIKRFYLIKNCSPQIQNLVMFKRKCIFDIHFVLERLAYCGLLQFGPARFKEKDQGFIYLNRNASLMETMTSEPGYHKISDKRYDRVYFYFDSLDTVTKYWFTMHNICMNTLLNARYVVEGKTITLIDVTAKPSLNKALSAKKQEEVKKYDNGDIPGDNQGAGGLDSAMWSHIQRNWFYFAPKPSQSFKNELDSLKLDQVMPEHVSFERLKLPAITSKFYLSKPGEVKPVTTRKIQRKKTSKKVPVVKKLIPLSKFRLKKKRKEYYDTVDKAILRKYSGIRFRPTWSEEEDKIVILLKVATMFLSPGASKQFISYTAMRDILHRIVPESRNKTSKSLPRRIKILYRDVPFVSNIEALIPNIYKLVPVARYFVPLRSYIINEKNASGKKFKLSEAELQNAFVFLAYYMLTHRKEVETALHGNWTTMDYFNKENVDYTITKIAPMEQEVKYYRDPTNVEEIRMGVLKNIIHCALGHNKDLAVWSCQFYKICQRFSQDILKSAIDELKEQHMITTKKTPKKKFFTPYRLSLTYIFAQTTTFTYNTMEEAYAAFRDLGNASGKLQVEPQSFDAKKYGRMFANNEVITFMLSQVHLKLWFPEHHLILNPALKDHTPVIEELARRYQAKMKNDQKDVELQDSTHSENTDIEVVEPEPESMPSTSNTEDIEILQFDDDEPLDLTMTSTNSTTITNLKHWISDCIDAERVRSPSPELLNLDVSLENRSKEARESEERLEEFFESKEREERVLNLEEIKEEIVRVTAPSEKRKVPYITDLAKLLSENFDEIDTDEQKIDEMKKHFIQQFPYLEELDVTDSNNHFIIEYLESRPIMEEIWKKVGSDAYVGEPSEKRAVFNEILEKGGSLEDVDLASELISFVCNKGVFGATALELKEQFNDMQGSCTLDYILKILTDRNILVRTGVCTLKFVHYTHQTPWLADTFVLTEEDVQVFRRDGAKDQLVKLQEGIDESLRDTQWIKVRTVPWANFDGSLDKDLFKVWLSSIFSYCIDNPKTLLTSLLEKFCYLKPVDIFYLVEILQDLGCVEMRRLQSQFDLFSEYEWNQDFKATFLDKFEDIYIEPNQISFCALGSFFHKA